ncbi:MAG: hypothetical protein V8T87_16240 [Victivallales bacterium]
MVGQRLIRRNCPRCKASFVPTDEDLALRRSTARMWVTINSTMARVARTATTQVIRDGKALTEIFGHAFPAYRSGSEQFTWTIVLRDKAREPRHDYDA